MKEAGGCTDALALPKAALKITFLPDGTPVSLAMHFSNFAPFMPGNILRTVLTLDKFAPSVLASHLIGGAVGGRGQRPRSNRQTGRGMRVLSRSGWDTGIKLVRPCYKRFVQIW